MHLFPFWLQRKAALVVAEQMRGEQLSILGQAALVQRLNPPANPESASARRRGNVSLKRRRCLCGCKGGESNPSSVCPIHVVYVAVE